MTGDCDECDRYRRNGVRFCGNCGKQLGYREPRPILDRSMLIITGITGLFLLMELAVLLWSTPGILAMIGTFGVDIVLLLPQPVSVAVLYGIAAEIYLILMVVALIGCVLLTIQQFALTAHSRDAGERPAMRCTGLFWIGALFSASLLVEVVLFAVSVLLGFEIDTGWISEFSAEEMLFLLANASVWEEIISRVLLIGLPIAVLQAVRTRSARSAVNLRGGFGMSRVAIALIILSGVIFGAAHYPGWGLAKAAITCISGIVLGYLFVRFGLYASVTMHFLTNYLGSFTYIGGSALDAISILGILAFLVFGTASLAYLATGIPDRKAAAAYLEELPLLHEDQD
jgi:hypothetical protein